MSPTDGEEGLTYEEAGVDISAQDEAIERLLPHVNKTRCDAVPQSPGGFAGLYEISAGELLAVSADGLGTKVLLTERFGAYRNAGEELVAAVFNDVVTAGAEPMFMLDYLGVPGIQPGAIEDLVAGMSEALEELGAALLGGEIAEMGDIYPDGTFDIVGFGVGRVNEQDIPDVGSIEPGDAVVGFASSGVHCNGLTLVRKVFEDLTDAEWREHDDRLGTSLADEILTPSRNYVPLVEATREAELSVKAWAHVSGGGVTDNLARVLPEGCGAEVDSAAVPRPEVFDIIAEHGGVAAAEMWHTFNMGAGFLAVVAERLTDELLECATAAGYSPFVAGRITENPGSEEKVAIGGITES